MTISRSDTFGYIRDDDLLAESYERRINNYSNQIINAYRNTPEDGRAGVQRKVNELIKQIGLTDYINKVQSEIEHDNIKQAQSNDTAFSNIQSLLDLPYIKDAIDKAIGRKQYGDYITLLNDLSNIVKYDDDIPSGLKNVFGDKKLNDYVQQKMPAKGDKLDYDLKPTQVEQNISYTNPESSSSYFEGFDKKQ